MSDFQLLLRNKETGKVVPINFDLTDFSRHKTEQLQELGREIFVMMIAHDLWVIKNLILEKS